MIAQGSSDDFKMFAKLAKGYIYEGTDKRRICSHNAEVGSTTSSPIVDIDHYSNLDSS